MKTNTRLLIAAITIMNARAGQNRLVAEQQVKGEVVVYVENDASVPDSVLFSAKALAAEIFAGVGVRINWREGKRMQSQLVTEGAIAVRLGRTPKNYKLTGVAYALPYGQASIVVLYDRLAWSKRTPSLANSLLAYVFVHEITHKLQGICRHSSAGIMKAKWLEDDYYYMQKKELGFTAEDVELIHSGLRKWDATTAKPAIGR